MAGNSARKTAQRNTKIIADLNFAAMACMLAHVVGRIMLPVVMRKNPPTIWTIVRAAGMAAIDWFVRDQLTKLGAAGTDLAEEGTMVAYYFDVIYIGWFVMVTTVFSSMFYWTYFAIPVFVGYKVWQMGQKVIASRSGAVDKNTSKAATPVDKNGKSKQKWSFFKRK